MSVATKMPIAAAVYTAALVLAGCSSSEPMQTALPQTGPAQDPTGATAEVPEAIGEPANVTRVIDGDTIEVALDNEIITVRLIGIDTPETVHPTEPVECYGPAASRFTTGALQGRPVRLEFDVERIDRYGRTLAYVWLGAELFNETLVAREREVRRPLPRCTARRPKPRARAMGSCLQRARAGQHWRWRRRRRRR
jgi:endonuclease YncB( thermonuclease family)